MKKPEDYELKKWLCSNVICGLKLHRYQTSCEDSTTDWELESISGEKRKFKDSSVCYYVNLKPDWISVLRVNSDVIAEVKTWDEYAEKEADELAEYERLKKKFEGG